MVKSGRFGENPRGLAKEQQDVGSCVMDESHDLLQKQIEAFEKSLGLTPGFIEQLKTDDDWSFIMKAHALLKGGMAQFLTHHLGKPSLEKLLSKMFMCQKT